MSGPAGQDAVGALPQAGDAAAHDGELARGRHPHLARARERARGIAHRGAEELRKYAPRPGEPAFDKWSLIHTASGMGLAFFEQVTWPILLALLVGYEVFEALLRRVRLKQPGKGLFEYESWPNIFADLAVAILGYAAVRALTAL